MNTFDRSVAPMSAGEPSDGTLHLAYAEASIMLIESLILVLSEMQLIELPTIMDAIETVIEAKRNQVDNDDHARISAVAIGVLSKLANSIAASKSARQRSS